MIICLGEKLGKADNGIQRCPYFMAHISKESHFHPVAFFYFFNMCDIDQKTCYAFNTSVRIIFKRNGEGICPAVIRVSVQHDP